jgi:hypothetical protein
MIHRRFGRTELQMPVFSCGGMRYQHQWQDLPLDQVPPDNQANLQATIHRSVELGVTHIETARGYGSSERQLGLVLPTFPRDRLIVQTKIPPHDDPARFTAEFEESLARLRLDHVDLLALHGINTHQHLLWSLRPGGCLQAARRLQRQGKARWIGFSTHASLEVILAAIETGAEFEGAAGFDYVNLHWYYIFQHNWPAIDAARRRDMGVFIISPSDKGGMLYQPPDKLVELCRPLHPLVFNCLFCLRRPEVHTLSLGASKPGDFDLQLSSLEFLDRVDELLPPIEARLRQAMVQAVGADAADRLDEGLPEWHDAPGYMNLKVMLWLRALALAYDLRDYGRMRYNLLGNGGHWFPGLNAAHAGDWNLSGALKHSPFKDRIGHWLDEAHRMFADAPRKRLSQS